MLIDTLITLLYFIFFYSYYSAPRHLHSFPTRRSSDLGDAFEQGQQVLHRANLLLMDEDSDIFEHAFHAVRVSDEVGREVAAVERSEEHTSELPVTIRSRMPSSA